jgi:hypothetical protein
MICDASTSELMQGFKSPKFRANLQLRRKFVNGVDGENSILFAVVL